MRYWLTSMTENMTQSNAEIIGTYERPAHGWTCFHCGETFTTPGGARDHFGADPTKEPGCMIRVQLGDERGLLMALRQAEEQLESYRNEDSETARQFHAMTSKHQTELRQEEERGYARGVADMRQELQEARDQTMLRVNRIEEMENEILVLQRQLAKEK